MVDANTEHEDAEEPERSHDDAMPDQVDIDQVDTREQRSFDVIDATPPAQAKQERPAATTNRRAARRERKRKRR